MEKILTAVPYPMVGPAGVVHNWGPICTDHPTRSNEPTDRYRESAEAFAEALACGHPEHAYADQVPQHTLNAVIVAAMLNYAYRPPRYEWSRHLPSADPAWRGWCDMTPVVTDVAPASDPFCPQDVWWVEVQYNTSGSRASFGVDRNNVPQCYQD